MLEFFEPREGINFLILTNDLSVFIVRVWILHGACPEPLDFTAFHAGQEKSKGSG